MDSICNNDVCSQQLDGLQETYTDFDSWICKFNSYCYTRYPQHGTRTNSQDELLKISQQNNYTDAQYVSISCLLKRSQQNNCIDTQYVTVKDLLKKSKINYCDDAQSVDVKDFLKRSQVSNCNDTQRFTINDLLIDGYLFSKIKSYDSKNLMKNELNLFLSLVKDGDAFVDFDSVLVKLFSERKHFHRYTKSKL